MLPNGGCHPPSADLSAARRSGQALAVIQIPQHAHTLRGDLHASCALLFRDERLPRASSFATPLPSPNQMPRFAVSLSRVHAEWLGRAWQARVEVGSTGKKRRPNDNVVLSA